MTSRYPSLVSMQPQNQFLPEPAKACPSKRAGGYRACLLRLSIIGGRRGTEQILLSLFGGPLPLWQPWKVTAPFYAAVHEVQSLLVEHSVRPLAHDQRRRELNARWPSLGSLYDSLIRAVRTRGTAA